MIVGGERPAHLTYCSNIHPGESWAEVRDNLEKHVLRVARAISGTAPFGVGLRLSDAAARELEAPGRLEELAAFLAANRLYVFTLNGFPYGTFHGSRVKEAVYLPDWRQPERLAYSERLARILAALLPDGVALNVNFPTATKPGSQFAFSRIGTFQLYEFKFRNTPPYGLGATLNDPSTATFWQAEDEAVVNATRVSVTAMQVSFDHNIVVQTWLRVYLRRLFH